MKKILVTLFQIGVTIAVLYWVYHDPGRRAVSWIEIRLVHARTGGLSVHIVHPRPAVALKSNR